MTWDSRHDSMAAHRAFVARHIVTCRDEDCEFEQDVAEDRKWEREGIA